MAEGRPLAPLLLWLSSSFPVGAFAYSHGLEWAAHEGAVHDAASLRDWVTDVITRGSGRNDAILVGVAHQAVQNGDDAALAEIAEWAAAFSPTSERRLETVQQGASFAACIRAAWPCAALERLVAVWPGDIAYPVALGTAGAGHGLDRRMLLEAFLLAFAANLASAAVRLSIVGQTQAQQMLAALAPLTSGTADEAINASLDDLGSATFASDLASAQHETQYSRLFRS